MKHGIIFFIEKIMQWLNSGWFENPILHRVYLQIEDDPEAEICTTDKLIISKYPPEFRVWNVTKKFL